MDLSTAGLEAGRLRLDCDCEREALVDLVDCERRPTRSTPRGVGGYIYIYIYIAVLLYIYIYIYIHIHVCCDIS